MANPLSTFPFVTNTSDIQDPAVTLNLIAIIDILNLIIFQLQVSITLTEDLRIDSSSNGLILKDTQVTPHYWRVTINNAGVLVTTDLGTALPP